MRGTKKYKIVKCFRHFGAIIILLWLISIVRFPYSFDKLQVLSNKNFESVSNFMLTLVDCKSTESKSSIDFLLTDGKQYYIKNVTASPVVICEAGELTNTSNTGIYKKKIYYPALPWIYNSYIWYNPHNRLPSPNKSRNLLPADDTDLNSHADCQTPCQYTFPHTLIYNIPFPYISHDH